MNILMLMLSTADAIGGMEKHSQELANGLSEKGNDVTFASSARHQTLLSPGIHRIVLDTQKSRRSPFLLLSIVRIINSGRFDIIHGQGSKAADVLSSISRFTSKSVKIVTIHNFKNRYPSYNAFCRIIAVSKALANDIGAPNTRVVYNGLRPTTAEHTLNDPPPAAEGPIWLSAGRLVKAKGFDFLIEAFKSVNGTLFIAGDGPEKANLEQQISRTEQQGKIKMLGHRDDLRALMDVVDGIVISSLREGFSYVFAEALFAGKPIISTNVPIANEFLDQNFIFHGSSPKAFGNMLNQNLEGLFAAQRQTRERALRELTFYGMVEQTLRVYRECHHD